MARQSIHNRRAGRGSTGGGASWISYSDMMAALLLIFVLILTYSLYQYFTMLETKTRELDEQKILVLAQQSQLDEKEKTLIIIQADLDQMQDKLTAKEAELNETQTILINQKKEVENLQNTLILQSKELEDAQKKLKEQQIALDTQASRIRDLVGVRTNIIQDLSSSLKAANLKANVDANGSIVLDNSVFFETNSSEIKEEGKMLLNRFIPVYLDVLLREEYADYLGEIIIEGHTDSSGTYEKNLKLSQQRALQVALYVLDMPGLTSQQRNLLQQILTATGKSWSDLIYDEYGDENKEASRRVEFKFSLKDADMIEEMQQILQKNDLD